MGRSEGVPEEPLHPDLRALKEANQRLEGELESLRERAGSFEALAENAASGLLIALTPEGHVYANRRASEITGYTIDELKHLGIAELVHPDEAPRILDYYQRRLAGETLPPRYETTLVHKDGHPIAVEIAPTATIWHGQRANMVVIRDLTETHQALRQARQANAALAESEERYRQLVEMSPYTIITSVGDSISFINPAGVKLFGATSPDQIEGKSILGFVPPGDRNLVAQRMRMVSEEGREAPLAQFHIQRLDGTAVEVEVQSTPGIYRKQPAFQTVVRDLTDQKRAEHRLRNINDSLRAVLTIADELMACHDTDTLCRRAVELARERLGLERCSLHLVNGSRMHGTYGTSLQGETTDERSHSYPGGDYWAQIREALPGAPHWGIMNQPYREWTGGEMDTLEGTEGVTVYTVVQAENEPLGVFYNDYAISGRPVDPNLQEVVAVYGSLLGNILHRQRAEQALRESERRFREMADLLPDLLFEIDLEGNLIYANHVAYRLTGYCQADLDRGMNLLHLLKPEQVRKARRRLRHVAATGEPLTAQYLLRLADGTMLPAEVRTTVRCDPDGTVIGFRGVVRDITERLQVEEAQRLAAVGELAAAMAHEFGNILAGMRSWAQLYRNSQGQEALDSLLAVVLRGSDRGGALCWNLMRLSHPPKPERQPLNIESPIEAALSMTAPELQHHQVTVVRDYHTGPNGHAVPARVFIDPAQMEQVFLNLFINACHAMASGGQLTIETNRVTGRRGDEVRVRVSDTGVGIPTENLSRVFEPFFTTKNGENNSGMTGHGLGLSVSYGIIRAHGGSLTVESEAGKGTTFELRLSEYTGPVTEQPRPEVAAAVCAAGDLAGRRVLVVDDDEDIRKSLEYALRADGYQPVVAANTRQAIEALGCAEFDLLITDLIMPGGGGAEVVAVATSQPEPPAMILITGKAGETLAKEMLHWGASHCFHKPFDLAALLATVKELLTARENG